MGEGEQLTQSSVCIVPVSSRGTGGTPLATLDPVVVPGPSWRAAQRLGSLRRLQRGLPRWEDLGCGAGCRLIYLSRVRLLRWRKVRFMDIFVLDRYCIIAFLHIV